MSRSQEDEKNKHISEYEMKVNNLETTVYHLTNVNEEVKEQLEDL